MTTTTIRSDRVLLGGVVASIILFLFSGAVNGGLLSTDFEVWAHGMGSMAQPPTQATSMVLWTIMSFIYGIGGVWMYAVIRPRFGAGAKTAVIAGFGLWLVSKLPAALDLCALGIFPGRMIAAQLVSSLVAMLVAVLVGARLYQE